MHIQVLWYFTQIRATTAGKAGKVCSLHRFWVSILFYKIASNSEANIIGCANKDLWGLCAPIFIIVVYSRTATSYFLGAKE